MHFFKIHSLIMSVGRYCMSILYQNGWSCSKILERCVMSCCGFEIGFNLSDATDLQGHCGRSLCSGCFLPPVGYRIFLNWSQSRLWGWTSVFRGFFLGGGGNCVVISVTTYSCRDHRGLFDIPGNGGKYNQPSRTCVFEGSCDFQALLHLAEIIVDTHWGEQLQYNGNNHRWAMVKGWFQLFLYSC